MKRFLLVEAKATTACENLKSQECENILMLQMLNNIINGALGKDYQEVTFDYLISLYISLTFMGYLNVVIYYI